MLLEHEGGYVNHPKDPGGATNLGITKRVYENWIGHSVSIEIMRNLKVHQAAPIYETNYWSKVKADVLPSGVDFCVFDLAVNAGAGRAARMLQRVVGVKADGAIGPMTLAAVAAMEPTTIINQYTSRREAFYRRLRTFSTFGRGWLHRNKKTQIAALEMASNQK